MARQPKARESKSRARIDNFAELQAKARSRPKADVAVNFGNVGMARQGRKILIMKARPLLPLPLSHMACQCVGAVLVAGLHVPSAGAVAHQSSMLPYRHFRRQE